MTDPRWTEETESLCDRLVGDCGCCGCTGNEAWRILDGLAKAGLLLPPGGGTREEWAVRVDRPHPKRHEKVGELVRLADRQTAEYGPRLWDGWVPVSRTVHTSPWREVPDDPA